MEVAGCGSRRDGVWCEVAGFHSGRRYASDECPLSPPEAANAVDGGEEDRSQSICWARIAGRWTGAGCNGPASPHPKIPPKWCFLKLSRLLLDFKDGPDDPVDKSLVRVEIGKPIRTEAAASGNDASKETLGFRR